MLLILDINKIKKNIYLMLNKTLKKNEKYKLSQKIVKSAEFCKVSRASNEIMLDRFYKGKEIEFPFAQYLWNKSVRNHVIIYINLGLPIAIFEFINKKNCWN